MQIIATAKLIDGSDIDIVFTQITPKEFCGNISVMEIRVFNTEGEAHFISDENTIAKYLAMVTESKQAYPVDLSTENSYNTLHSLLSFAISYPHAVRIVKSNDQLTPRLMNEEFSWQRIIAVRQLAHNDIRSRERGIFTANT